MQLNSEQYPFATMPVSYDATCPRCSESYRIYAEDIGRFKWTHCPLCNHEMQAKKEEA